jgi:type III restriction enzyme
MSQVVIENPIINSPFDEPMRHFRFADEGITDEVVVGRRSSSYFVPIAKLKKKGTKQLLFDTEWTQDRLEENRLVNDIRRRVVLWRQGGYVGVTPTLLAWAAQEDLGAELVRLMAAELQTGEVVWGKARTRRS